MSDALGRKPNESNYLSLVGSPKPVSLSGQKGPLRTHIERAQRCALVSEPLGSPGGPSASHLRVGTTARWFAYGLLGAWRLEHVG